MNLAEHRSRGVPHAAAYSLKSLQAARTVMRLQQIWRMLRILSWSRRASTIAERDARC